MSQIVLSLERSNRTYRIAVGSLFLLLGLSSATWASRIPTIQQSLQLTDAALGIVLFAVPVGSMLSLPLAGWLVTRFGSKRVAVNALLLYSVVLITLGYAQNIFQLIIGLVLFGMAGNTGNIAINTQAVGVEAKYGRNIMASFHGLWSLAGFTAAGIGTFMIGNNIVPAYHFLIITGVILFGIAISFPYLLPNEERSTSSAKLFVKPDRPLLMLGIIAFCSMICEGAMFDWSGIYFQKVVHAPKAWIGVGYTGFMCTMATGRFFADWVAQQVGLKKTIQYSGLLIATGLGIAVIFPNLLSSLLGFLLVGFGVSSIVPLVYSEAGKSKTFTPGVALAAVSSIGFLGFLAGPPLIGVVAGLSGLRTSYVIIAIMGLCVAFVVHLLKQENKISESGTAVEI